MIKVFTGPTLAQGADIALKNRLYVSGWALSGVLVSLRKSQHAESHYLALKFVDGIPVALAYYGFGDLQAFCKKTERRKGYSSQCVRAIIERCEKNGLDIFSRRLHYGDGIDGSYSFWAQILPEEVL